MFNKGMKNEVQLEVGPLNFYSKNIFVFKQYVQPFHDNLHTLRKLQFCALVG